MKPGCARSTQCKYTNEITFITQSIHSKQLIADTVFTSSWLKVGRCWSCWRAPPPSGRPCSSCSHWWPARGPWRWCWRWWQSWWWPKGQRRWWQCWRWWRRWGRRTRSRWRKSPALPLSGSPGCWKGAHVIWLLQLALNVQKHLKQSTIYLHVSIFFFSEGVRLLLLTGTTVCCDGFIASVFVTSGGNLSRCTNVYLLFS